MESPESVRLIGRCKWCGCILYGRFFMNSLEEMFWQEGYPDCKHYDPDYSIEEKEGDMEGLKMTPKEFCLYVINGKIFDDIDGGDSDFAELGRYIWPERYDKLRQLAEEALKIKTCPKCGEPHPVLHCENCGHNWEED